MTKNDQAVRNLPDLETADLAALQELHSQMLATASDLAFEPPSEVLTEIETEEQGREICRLLHESLTAHHQKVLAESGTESDNGPQHGKKTAKKKAADKKPAAKKAADKPVAEEKAADNEKEKSVATAPKKAAAKKTAKKKPAKKASKKVAKRASIDEAAKIQWVRTKEGNGAREGTPRHERRELLRKHSGKTVKTYLAAGGKAATLKRAIKDKDARLEGGAAA